MKIINYVMKNPLITVWGLGILAIVLSWISSGSEKQALLHNINRNDTVVNSSLNNQSKSKETVIEDKVSVNKIAQLNDVRPTIIPSFNSLEQKVDNLASVVHSEQTSQLKIASSRKQEGDTSTASVIEQGTPTANEPVVTKTELKVASKNNEIVNEQDSQREVAVQDNSSARDLTLLSATDLLFQARKAFWKKDYALAISYYQALIKREPRTISHRGELGNVFWHSGRERDAASLYGQIAEPMIHQGQTNNVLRFIGFISAYFPERADQLTKMIQAQQSEHKLN